MTPKEIFRKTFALTLLFCSVVLIPKEILAVEIINPRCEYVINPIGIDSQKPRFTWQFENEESGFAQAAFELYVGTDSIELANDYGNVWNSGKIKSGKNLCIYNGEKLLPFVKYYWRIRVWDKDNELSARSGIAHFETGMMEVKNWKGDWISDSQDINLKPAPWFRKEFTSTKKIKSARVYIATGGLYELYLNGKKVGNQRLDPMYTRFDRRVLYTSHDVTTLLDNAENAIGVLLGNGWYNHQSTAVWYFDEAPWRARPKFCLDLHLTFTDGTKEIVSSGTDWKTDLSDVIFNSIYTAEHQDARKKQAGWNMPGFDDSKWKGAIPVSAPTNNIVAQNLHPNRESRGGLL